MITTNSVAIIFTLLKGWVLNSVFSQVTTKMVQLKGNSMHHLFVILCVSTLYNRAKSFALFEQNTTRFPPWGGRKIELISATNADLYNTKSLDTKLRHDCGSFYSGDGYHSDLGLP
jgi:hypothetical protein